MEEELTKKWTSFSLIEQERTKVILPSSILDKAEAQRRSCLFALIIADKTINKEAFKSTTSRIWKSEGWIQYNEVGENRYLVKFQNEEDRKRVIIGRLWSFDR